MKNGVAFDLRSRPDTQLRLPSAGWTYKEYNSASQGIGETNAAL